MINYLIFSQVTFLNFLSLLSVLLGIILSLLIFLFSKNKELFSQILGTFLILSLSFAINNWFVYALGIIIVATLVTELEFLEKVMALLWDREKYWEYLLRKDRKEQGENNSPSREITDEIQKVKDNEKQLAKLLNETRLQVFFEKTYRLIFGSQLNIVNILKTTDSLSRDLAEAIHRRTIHYGKYPFDNFIGYLLSSQLIKFNRDNNSYSITPLGSLFIDYLNTNAYTLNKPF